MFPGNYLRQVRERLGLTYRDVEQASYELAERHGRPEFIIHISRLADFENSSVLPSLHKLFTLCSVYHLDFQELCRWYGVPLADIFGATTSQAPPRKIARSFEDSGQNQNRSYGRRPRPWPRHIQQQRHKSTQSNSWVSYNLARIG